MKIYLVLFTVMLLGACEAGKISEDRKRLYEYNNNQEYCDEHPDRCVNNIPWS